MDAENLLKDKRKRCIEWNVRTSSNRIFSKIFSFQNKNCHLEFSTGFPSNCVYPDLYFRCSYTLQLPIDVTLRIAMNSKTYSQEIISLTSGYQQIWKYKDCCEITNCLMTFELTFHDDCSKDDKSLQTASYITNNVSMRSLAEDFSKLLETGTDHDVEMKCGENRIKAHKLVLGARSDVFRAMLQTDMLEASTGVIEIQEMDDRYFREFTRYLYTDEMPELTFEKAKALFVAGDKYNIQSLVLRCAEYLEDILCSENAFEIYALADTHSCEKLKESVKVYLLEEEVYLQDEHWMPFYENFPKVALEVYRLSHEKDTPGRKKSKKVA